MLLEKRCDGLYEPQDPSRVLEGLVPRWQWKSAPAYPMDLNHNQPEVDIIASGPPAPLLFGEQPLVAPQYNQLVAVAPAALVSGFNSVPNSVWVRPIFFHFIHDHTPNLYSNI